MTLSNTIFTAKPPLNIFEVTRTQLQGNTWFQVIDVPKYVIPATSFAPSSTINTAVIITGLIVSNLYTDDITVSVRIIGQDGGEYPVIKSAPVPSNDFFTIGLERHLLLSGEKLEITCDSNTFDLTANHASAHFSYIINQREVFTEESPS